MDKVLLCSPVYHAFFRTIENTGRIVAESTLINNEGYYTIDFDDLEAQFKAGIKMMIFCNPHNPGGRVWTEQEVNKVCQLCHAYNVYLISDEIWADMVFGDHKFYSCLRVDSQYFDRLAVCIAGTKTFGLPSLRLTNTMIPNEKEAEVLKTKLLAYGIDVYSIFSIVANQAAYRHGKEWVDETVQYLEANNHLLEVFVRDELMQVSYRPQESTYLAWLDCRAMGLDDEVLEKRLHQAGVIPTMGYGFGRGGNGFIRLNLGCPRMILEEKIKRLRLVLR